jgi:hypothetical protein
MDASRGEGEWVVSMANLTLLTATVVTSYDAQFRQLNAGSNALSMRGTVQKKFSRAKLFLLTQHEQIFCRALALAQAQVRG